jgi:hydroxylamine reductase (hybrid-cluster protein)
MQETVLEKNDPVQVAKDIEAHIMKKRQKMGLS